MANHSTIRKSEYNNLVTSCVCSLPHLVFTVYWGPIDETMGGRYRI
jgi:hypothetical protein